MVNAYAFSFYLSPHPLSAINSSYFNFFLACGKNKLKFNCEWKCSFDAFRWHNDLKYSTLTMATICYIESSHTHTHTHSHAYTIHTERLNIWQQNHLNSCIKQNQMHAHVNTIKWKAEALISYAENVHNLINASRIHKVTARNRHIVILLCTFSFFSSSSFLFSFLFSRDARCIRRILYSELQLVTTNNGIVKSK